VSEKDREFIPVGVTTAVTKDAREPAPVPSAVASLPESTKTATPSQAANGTGTIKVVSTPTGADVYVDARMVVLMISFSSCSL
jgi:hypothetical protein